MKKHILLSVIFYVIFIAGCSATKSEIDISTFKNDKGEYLLNNIPYGTNTDDTCKQWGVENYTLESASDTSDAQYIRLTGYELIGKDADIILDFSDSAYQASIITVYTDSQFSLPTCNELYKILVTHYGNPETVSKTENSVHHAVWLADNTQLTLMGYVPSENSENVEVKIYFQQKNAE